MTMYPNIQSVDLPCARYDEIHLAAMRALAAGVRKRTGASAWFDTKRDKICFGWSRPDGDISIVVDFRVFRSPWPERSGPDYFRNEINEDSIVHCLNLAKVDPRLKAKWKAISDALQKQQEERYKASALDGVEGDIKHRLNLNMGKTVVTG